MEIAIDLYEKVKEIVSTYVMEAEDTTVNQANNK